jgi:hypothetical protein
MFASVTRLRVRSLIYLPWLVWQTRQSQTQVEKVAGFVGGRLLADKHRTFWTLTVWETDKAMKVFRGSGAHAKVMPRLATWCNEAAYAHWETGGETVPTWPEAYRYLLTTGKLFPSEPPIARPRSQIICSTALATSGWRRFKA